MNYSVSRYCIITSFQIVLANRKPSCPQVFELAFNLTDRLQFNTFFQHVECPETPMQSACHSMKQGIRDGKVINFATLISNVEITSAF